MDDEEEILAVLFPEKSRPTSLEVASLRMYARIPTARVTIKLPTEFGGAKILLECALLAPDQYVLQGTIVADKLDTLKSVRSRLAEVADIATMPVQSKVVKSLELRNPELYAQLCSCGVVPREVCFRDFNLLKEPALDLGIPSSRSSMAAQERVCETELLEAGSSPVRDDDASYADVLIDEEETQLASDSRGATGNTAG
jgi:hypothetical protein